MPAAPIDCLLIDDDLDDQEIFAMALKKISSSISCHFASDGVQALNKLQSDMRLTPTCIFIDINMPRMNGIQCLKEIKKIGRLKNVPVYMYSTSEDEQMKLDLKHFGAVDMIIKPTSVTGLVKTLENILGLPG